MPIPSCGDALHLPPESADAYHGAITALSGASIPHLVGGAYALAFYTGVVRHTKDFDLFIKPADLERSLTVLARSGYRTEVVFPYWLSKAFAGEFMIDLLYRSPNGVAEVTDHWHKRAQPCRILGTPARVCAPEELLITKLYVLNNDRSDLADVMHLFYSCAEQIDWQHLLALLGSHWPLLRAHLILFEFVYPSEWGRIPRDLLNLLDRLEHDRQTEPPGERVCNGTLLSHSQYAIDLAQRGFADGRLQPHGSMTRRELIDSTISLDDPERARILRESGER